MSLEPASSNALKDALARVGFEQTNYRTETGSIWIHREKKRHLTVPDSADGFIPSWMMETLVEQAKALGDDALVDAIQSASGLKDMIDGKPKRSKARKPAKQ